MLDSFKDFKIEEISDWSKEYVNFIIKPKKVIDKIFEKKSDEIFRQFLFYFSVYTASFLFLSLSTSITQWIKPAVINLFTSIPLIILFIISTKFLKKKYKYSKIVAYVFGFQFITIPIIILIFATFLTTENYTYKFISDIFSSIAIIYLLFNFGFAIEEKKSKALKLTLISYLILNLLYFGFQRIDIDPYANVNFNETDPIFSEYYLLTKPIENKGTIPTTRFVTVFNDKVETYFSLQNIITDSVSRSTNQQNADYLKKIERDINHIVEQKANLKFRRNINASSLWYEYLNDIKTEAKFKFTDVSQISELNSKPLPLGEISEIGVKGYIAQTDLGKIIKTQIPLKSYHNSIITNSRNSTIASEVSHRIVFFFGYVLDYVIGDLILKDGAPKEYKEVFLEFEE
jgi:hypothetical protein